MKYKIEIEHLGPLKHYKKAKPMNYRYRRRTRNPGQRCRKYLQPNYRTKLPQPKERDF